MATTYTLISSNTLGASAASVTFSSIPSTYTDLVLRTSLRADNAATTRSCLLTFNGTTTNYSNTYLYGSGSTTSTSNSTGNAGFQYNYADGASATANTFASAEFYVPNYLASANKPVSLFQVQEDNATAAYALVEAGLWSNTAAITSITVTCGGGNNFVSGSSFYLYGVKNS